MVTLRPFTVDLLDAVRPWFHHPEVNRWLGGPDWPGMQFRMTDEEDFFRGRRVLRGHSWVAVDDAGDVVAQIGGEVYDRWCRYDEGPDGPIIDAVEAGPAMGFAYVVDPRRWRQGVGVATLLAAMDAPEVADVVLFAAGIEPENQASVRCARSAGMLPTAATPDGEGIIHYVRRFPARGARMVE